MSKLKITEQPILNVKIEVDKSYGDRFEQRMNWQSMSYIDLVDVFMTPLPNEVQSETLVREYELAKKRALRFKARLKAYIIEKADESELKNFDWSEWDIV